MSILSRLIEISPLHLTREPLNEYGGTGCNAECERTHSLLIAITEDSFIANYHGLNSEANKASSESDSLLLLLVKTKMSQFTTKVMRAGVGMKGGDAGLLHA